MSRIDQALRMREGVTDAPGSETPIVELPSLAHYPNESALRPEPEPHVTTFEPELIKPTLVDPTVVQQPVVEPTAVAPVPTPKRVSKSLDNAGVQARLVTGASSSVSAEQYRRLAAVLHEEQAHGKLKTVMVTSALPSEGKTLTVVNLALTLSGSYGRRVLVIDADLRAPSMHRLLGVRNSRGLSDTLRDRPTALPLVEVSPRLSVLTAGRPGPSPLSDLTSERMGEVIRECAASFDWVLVDTPPVGLLSDAQVLARLVNGVIFVIAAGSTPAAAVERAVSELGAESIIGTVLNRVENRYIPEANYYDEYYGYDDGE
jgi:capsular exopolysaccharide synthesis family protein